MHGKTGDPLPPPSQRCSLVADHTEVNFAPLWEGEPSSETTRRTGHIYLREQQRGTWRIACPSRPGSTVPADPAPARPASPAAATPPSLPGTHPENAPTCSATGELFYGFRTPTICPPSIQSTSHCTSLARLRPGHHSSVC